MRITERRGNVSAADEYCCAQSMIPQPLTDDEVDSLTGVLGPAKRVTAKRTTKKGAKS